MMDFQKEHLSPQKATSINSHFNRCMQSLKVNYQEKLLQKKENRLIFPFGFDEFKKMLSACAKTIMLQRNDSNNFIIDPNNLEVIENLYIYLKGDKTFSGSLNKGIILVGKIGCGKTLILQALGQVYNTLLRTMYLRKPMFSFYRSVNLQRAIQDSTIREHSFKPLIIDELGREPKQIMDYGNEKSPIIELLCERYDNGAWTLATSNFTLDTLSSDAYYGKMTGDRLRAMFNVLEVKGGRRR